MPDSLSKKRKLDSRVEKRRVPKKVRRQLAYSSGSSSESEVNGDLIARDAPKDETMEAVPGDRKHLAKKTKLKTANGTTQDSNAPTLSSDENTSDSNSQVEPSQTEDSATSGDDVSESDSGDDENGTGPARRKTKRRDPEVFANSLQAILSSKLPTSKREDPVLARSKDAQEANHEIHESRLEVKAKRKLRDEKRQAKERGRVKDVLLGERGSNAAAEQAGAVDNGMTAAEIAEQEKRLRKTAQRGVVKLFNAVRAAQVRGEQAARAVRKKGVVGHQQREAKVGEMGRQAFLDMLSGGGNTKQQG